MHRPIDTLYFQWALSEEDKTTPNIFEEVLNTDDAEKVQDLLGVFAHMTVDVMESEIMRAALVEDYALRAEEDPEILQGVDPEEIVEAIEQFPDVLEASEAVDSAAHRLDMFQKQLVKALTNDEE